MCDYDQLANSNGFNGCVDRDYESNHNAGGDDCRTIGAIWCGGKSAMVAAFQASACGVSAGEVGSGWIEGREDFAGLCEVRHERVSARAVVPDPGGEWRSGPEIA